MKCIYSKYFNLISIFIYIIFQISSFYQIIYSSCNCYQSNLWIFCISSGGLIPTNLIIFQFSPLKIRDLGIHLVSNLIFLSFDLLLLLFGINELFIKCTSLVQCYIWIYGIINCSLLVIVIILIIIFGWKNHRLFMRIDEGFSNSLVQDIS